MAELRALDITRTVFPVVALAEGGETQAARPDFFGTAFSVGKGVFITAAHVVSAAVEHGNLALGGPADEDGNSVGVVEVPRHELFLDYDIAILFCEVQGATALDAWLAGHVPILMDVETFGYPHAVTWTPDGKSLNVVFRGYKGHVITTRSFDRLPKGPPIYEVSCPFPTGLSGSPVLFRLHDSVAVAGVVLGTDTVEYGGVEHRVGAALLGEVVMSLHSKTLGGPVGSMLGLDAALIRSI